MSKKPLEIDQVWLQRIISNLEGLEFGSLLITVHDGKIMQIERTERRRFESDLRSDKSRTGTKKNDE